MMTAMKFTYDLTYDASPDDVLAMLSDPAFRDQVCDAMQATRRDIAIDGDGAGMKVVVDQTQPARGMPSFAKKFVGDEIQIVQTETWSDLTAASLDIAIPGKPGSFTGTIALATTGDGTTETVSGDVKVKVPMLGGKLEGLVADMLRSALKAEQRVGRAWLAG